MAQATDGNTSATDDYPLAPERPNDGTNFDTRMLNLDKASEVRAMLLRRAEELRRDMARATSWEQFLKLQGRHDEATRLAAGLEPKPWQEKPTPRTPVINDY